MKPTFVFLALLASSLAVPLDSTACLSKNPFLKKLQYLGILIHHQPEPDQNYCKIEWGSSGTCCDPHSLVQYAAADAEKIKGQLNNVTIAFKYYVEFIKDFKQVLLQIAALDDFNWRGLVKNSTEADHLDKFIKKIKSLYLARPFFYAYEHKIWEEKLESNDKCWNKMSQLRNSALCSTCSGSSQAFFFNHLANIPMETCKLVMDDCLESFKFLNGLLYRWKYSEKQYKLADQLGIDLSKFISFHTEQMVDASRIKQIANQLEGFGIRRLVEDYDPSKVDINNQTQVKQSEWIESSLCQKYFKIQGKTILEQLDSAIEKRKMNITLGPLTQILVGHQKAATDEKHYKDIIRDLVQRNKVRFSKRNEIKKQEELALLQGLLDDDDDDEAKGPTKKNEALKVLKSDSAQSRKLTLEVEGGLNLDSEINVIVQSDNMFTAVDGSKGTSVNLEHSNHKVMNLSLIFP